MENSKVRRRVVESGGISVAAVIILLVLEVFAFIVLVRLFELNYLEGIIVAATLLLGFFIIILAVPRERKVYVQRIIPKEVEKIVEKPVVNEVVHYVDRPVKQPVKKKTVKPVSYSYVASTDSKMFHPTSSRLARLIRPKNRVYGNTYKQMQKKGYKPSQKAKEFFKKHKK
jgi:hypothetical protein